MPRTKLILALIAALGAQAWACQLTSIILTTTNQTNWRPSAVIVGYWGPMTAVSYMGPYATTSVVNTYNKCDTGGFNSQNLQIFRSNAAATAWSWDATVRRGQSGGINDIGRAMAEIYDPNKMLLR